MSRIATFDDWYALLEDWRKDIGLDRALTERFLPGYQLEAKYGVLPSSEIGFGDYRGDRRWQRLLDVPDQRIRDALLGMIVVQGDTEFASNEQQRFLVNNAPSDYDLAALVRIMMEETRHGFQMCHLLITHFGADGKIEAEKLLERRAFGKRNRLLKAFNEDVTHWLDFFAYTNFMDRDGKFQLSMLSHSSFEPLAQSMVPMLREESFHMGVGISGLRRIAAAGVIPVELQQKYYNKWISGSLDLFGNDHSSSAQWAYAWGIKGRVDESSSAKAADREHLNEQARDSFYQEIAATVERVNAVNAQPEKLYVPHMAFNRKIGRYAGTHFTVGGQPLDDAQWARYAPTVLPVSEDEARLSELFKNPNWIAPKSGRAGAEEGAR
ncbi:MAG: phenylacetate-CoA oxygenase subunit PaaI [Candidatus Eremiobacteraeota bacterium]|nr:phenylacetate-CoA oxygenase subunit PaaI [Candidatus Eremiobacteraeota bacterium]